MQTAVLSARRSRFVGEYLIDDCGTQAAIRSGVGLFGVNTRARHCMKVQGERSSLMAGAKMSALGRMVAYLKPSALYACLSGFNRAPMGARR